MPSILPVRQRCRAIACAATLITFATSSAQWSHNPAINTGISTGGSDQNQSKILSTADGGAYIVWLDGIGTGWDTRLQRVDANGIKQFAGNGVLIANTAFSSTQDYGFDVDADGNALIAYRDDNNAGAPVQIKVQKVDPAGNLLWGTGVQVSAVAGGSSPHCCATTDGGAAVGWTEGSSVRVQKVNGKGLVQWAAGGVIDTPGAGIYFICDVAPDAAGGAITLYHHQTGGFSSPRHLKMQRFGSAAGAKLWGDLNLPLIIFDGGSIQLGNFPAIIRDGKGGAIVAWYNTGGARNAHVQHVDQDGVEVFAHNGLTIASDVGGRIRISAAAGYDQGTGDIYMVAEESDASPQGNYNLRAQRFNAVGARQWTDLGVVLFGVNANHPSFAQTRPLVAAEGVANGGAIFAWYLGPNNNIKVQATRLDSLGAFAWSPSILDISSAASNKARLASTTNAAADRVFLSWGDSRSDANDIFAQAINLNGSLGTPGDVTDNGIVDVDDLLGVINAWGPSCAPPAFCPADLAPTPTGNGVIDVDDLLEVINNWG
jgi:hypothetical protein